MGITKMIMEVIDFIERIFSRPYGIRALYFMLLLVPSLSLLWLYNISLKENNELRKELDVYKIRLHDCIDEKEDLKETVRDEVMEEFQTTLELINNFKNVISKDNEELIKKAEKVSEKINNMD